MKLQRVWSQEWSRPIPEGYGVTCRGAEACATKHTGPASPVHHYYTEANALPPTARPPRAVTRSTDPWYMFQEHIVTMDDAYFWAAYLEDQITDPAALRAFDEEIAICEVRATDPEPFTYLRAVVRVRLEDLGALP